MEEKSRNGLMPLRIQTMDDLRKEMPDATEEEIQNAYYATCGEFPFDPPKAAAVCATGNKESFIVQRDDNEVYTFSLRVDEDGTEVASAEIVDLSYPPKRWLFTVELTEVEENEVKFSTGMDMTVEDFEAAMADLKEHFKGYLTEEEVEAKMAELEEDKAWLIARRNEEGM